MTPSAASARRVVILARTPSAPGKTRLTAHLPEDRARQLRERLLLDTLTAARAACDRVVVSYTPDDAQQEMRRLLGDTTLIPQRGEELGARMRNAINDVLMTGDGAVVLIGSDLPTLPPAYIVNAFDLLEPADPSSTYASPPVVGRNAPRPDVVVGPSEDGGFYLLGSRRPMPDLFNNIEWGRNDVFVRVVARVHEAGLTISSSRPWWDVDERDDLLRVGGHYAAFWS